MYGSSSVLEHVSVFFTWLSKFFNLLPFSEVVQFTENFIDKILFILVLSFQVEIFQFDIFSAYNLLQNECNRSTAEWEISGVESHKFDAAKPSIFNNFGVEVGIKNDIEQIYSLSNILFFLISQLVETGSN